VDARVRVRAANDRRVQHSIDAQVVDIPPTAREETSILETSHARADGRGHGRVAV
jgi:hypothetical protein